MPVPRPACPRIVVSRHALPSRPRVPSAFRTRAMAIGARTGGKHLEYPHDNGGLLGDDPPLAAERIACGISGLRGGITVATPAAEMSSLDPAAQSAMGLCARSRRNSAFMVPFRPTWGTAKLTASGALDGCWARLTA